jgi:hypothetical protein
MTHQMSNLYPLLSQYPVQTGMATRQLGAAELFLELVAIMGAEVCTSYPSRLQCIGIRHPSIRIDRRP